MISVITCSHDDARFSALNAMYARLLYGEPHEIIRISDAASISEGYNRAIAQSRGELLVFSHHDVEIHCETFARLLAERLNIYDMIGVVGTTLLNGPAWGWEPPPHCHGQIIEPRGNGETYEVVIFSNGRRHVGQVQALDGMFMAMRRKVAEEIGFDAENFQWHHYDLDASYRAFRAGCKLGICCDFDLVHHSGGDFGPAWERSAHTFVRKHRPHMPLGPKRRWNPMTVLATSFEDALQRLHPPHWESAVG